MALNCSGLRHAVNKYILAFEKKYYFTYIYLLIYTGAAAYMNFVSFFYGLIK